MYSLSNYTNRNLDWLNNLLLQCSYSSCLVLYQRCTMSDQSTTPTPSSSPSPDSIPDILSLSISSSEPEPPSTNRQISSEEFEIDLFFSFSLHSSSVFTDESNDLISLFDFDLEINEDNSQQQKRLPALNVLHLPTDTFIQDLINNCTFNFRYTPLREDRTIIETFNQKDFSRVKSYLDRKNLQYFSYALKKEKCKSYVVCGLPIGTNVIDLKSDVLSKQTPTLRIRNVVEFTDYKVRKKSKRMQPFIVQIDRTSSRKELYSIKNILGFNVTWKLFERQSVVQCHRCQRLGHVSFNCRMNYRCVKCGISHHTVPCLFGGGVKTPAVFCVLCGLTGHTSSYRGCPTFLRFKQFQLKSKKMLVQGKVDRLNERRLKRQEKRFREEELQAAYLESTSELEENDRIMYYLKFGLM